jgi:hypothetical protein
MLCGIGEAFAKICFVAWLGRCRGMSSPFEGTYQELMPGGIITGLIQACSS